MTKWHIQSCRKNFFFWIFFGKIRDRLMFGPTLYRMSQEERTIFCEVILSVVLSKKLYTCVLFRTVSEIELFHCTVPKFLIRKRYYVLFLIPVFIVQVTKLVQFTFPKIPPSTSMHFAPRVRSWRVARLYSVLYNETVRNRTIYIYIYTSIHFLLRMTDTMTSQNIDLSSWDTCIYFSNYLWSVMCTNIVTVQVWTENYLLEDI
jgi:hypothetical protein